MSSVGKLSYLLVVYRPNLNFVVSSSSQVSKSRSHDRWLLAKKNFRYSKGAFEIGLLIKHSECLNLVGFCDSDWGGYPNDRRSASDHRFKTMDDSSIIC